MISFTPSKNKPYLYAGVMEVLKENYALKKFEAKLVFNKKNYYDVISMQKNLHGSRYYYESARVNFSFKKCKMSRSYDVDKMFVSLNIGRVIKKTDKRVLYTVKTDLQFNQISQYVKSDDGINLMNHLYIEAEKLKRPPE